MIHWKQCPNCATWFMTKYGQKRYCTDRCRARLYAKAQRMINAKELSMVSINGDMYERRRHETNEFV